MRRLHPLINICSLPLPAPWWLEDSAGTAAAHSAPFFQMSLQEADLAVLGRGTKQVQNAVEPPGSLGGFCCFCQKELRKDHQV